MPDRPEYVKCIRHTHEERKRTSWCGREIEPFEFAFTDIDHAAYERMRHGRLLICPECLKAVVETLQNKE